MHTGDGMVSAFCLQAGAQVKSAAFPAQASLSLPFGALALGDRSTVPYLPQGMPEGWGSSFPARALVKSPSGQTRSWRAAPAAVVHEHASPHQVTLLLTSE